MLADPDSLSELIDDYSMLVTRYINKERLFDNSQLDFEKYPQGWRVNMISPEERHKQFNEHFKTIIGIGRRLKDLTPNIAGLIESAGHDSTDLMELTNMIAARLGLSMIQAKWARVAACLARVKHLSAAKPGTFESAETQTNPFDFTTKQLKIIASGDSRVPLSDTTFREARKAAEVDGKPKGARYTPEEWRPIAEYRIERAQDEAEKQRWRDKLSELEAWSAGQTGNR